jgi:hypothetical protein
VNYSLLFDGDITGLSEVLKKVEGGTDLDVFTSLMELDDPQKRTILGCETCKDTR